MTDYDSIVVGAGLSGLTAAIRLTRNGQRVKVLEARDRCGGRTWTTPSADGIPVDIGGQWVGPTQQRVLALIDELGLQTIPQFDTGRNILELNGRAGLFTGTIPSLPPWGLIDLQIAMWRIEAMSRQLSTDTPWSAKRAGRWDNFTVEHWLQQSVRTETARRVLRISVNAVFAVEPNSLSFLQFLFYIRSAGGLMKLVDARGGAQDRRIVGGAQQLSDRLANNLRAAGGEIALSTPVRRIGWSESAVEVDAGGQTLRADRLVVAMAPAAATQLGFDPLLSTRRQSLMRQMPMGSVIKCIALYKEPFWRGEGYSGEMVTDAGPLRMCFDVSPPGEAGTPGGLVGFILGAEAVRMSDVDCTTRRSAVLAQLTHHFGPQAASPIDFIEQDWCTDPWAQGCYVGHPAPGVLSAYGSVIREVVGPIHWAGTETATRWNGYMDGAIEAGERAANEILAAI